MINQTDAVPSMTPQLWYSPRPRLEVKRGFTSRALNEFRLVRRGTQCYFLGGEEKPTAARNAH